MPFRKVFLCFCSSGQTETVGIYESVSFHLFSFFCIFLFYFPILLSQYYLSLVFSFSSTLLFLFEKASFHTPFMPPSFIAILFRYSKDFPLVCSDIHCSLDCRDAAVQTEPISLRHGAYGKFYHIHSSF